MSEVEGRSPIDPPPLMPSCNFCRLMPSRVKVTVQFETEGNGQNEIFSHMDRSEVKL